MSKFKQIPEYVFSCVFRFKQKKKSGFLDQAWSWDKQKVSLTVLGDRPSSSQTNLVYVTVKLARDLSCRAGMLQLELAAGAHGAG